ncbi:unnamed protein product [Mytilus edulis]|uniref:Mab-21-like nucleotidyltransferase domain-containing protein n=1 Tax=Mytilus edulis TaxID=6550 RepID=A0A8S3PVA8_MYTED|nr:unnamed protein product [Mytilus edulis]
MELPDGVRKMNFCDLIKELERQSSPRPSDYSMNKLYSYITRFLSHFSKERFMIGGSTEENTRLRTSIDDGDYDYLLISEIAIPSEYIEYKRDRPSCFVHVNGSFMQEQFPDIEMVDGKYLPSSLLSEIKPEAYKHVGDIIKLLCENDDKIGVNEVKIVYSRKKHKDYIPMFPIKGNPKGLDKWIKRDRKSHWPPEDTVNRVSKCQFFFVAKPAPVKAEKEKDFCLAYSMAEKELSEALRTVQKRVLLIVKAFNKYYIWRLISCCERFRLDTYQKWQAKVCAMRCQAF